MDQSRFDDITRVLAAPLRRSLFAAAGVVGLATLLGWDDRGVGAKKKKKKKCKNGTKRCGKKCVNLQTDASNCGSCGNGCDDGQTCASGQCSGCVAAERPCALPGGETECIPDDDDHCCTQADCGGPSSDLQCDHAGGFVCHCAGSGVGRCPPPDDLTCHTCCDGGAGDDGCPGNQTCASGAVRCECEKPGFAVVPGCGSNCVCGPTCQVACAPDWTCCPEFGCVNLPGCGPNTNGCNGQLHCGTRGHACTELETCCLGTCLNLASMGLTHCPPP